MHGFPLVSSPSPVKRSAKGLAVCVDIVNTRICTVIVTCFDEQNGNILVLSQSCGNSSSRQTSTNLGAR